MANLWSEDAGGWSSRALEASGDALGDGVVVRRTASSPFGEEWLLLAGVASRVAVNGDAPCAGLVVLRDRDEIRLAGRVRFFTARNAAAVERWPDGTALAALRCPRCRRRIEEGTAVVRCPGCGVVHHESDALPCWTYAERCAACPEPTVHDEASRWTPEEL